MDIGSSYLPSDINAAILWNQLKNLEKIQKRRNEIHEYYMDGLNRLADKGFLRLPKIIDFADSNYHLFYLPLKTEDERDQLINYLRSNGIHATFHYVPLHSSELYIERYGKKIYR